MLLAGFLAAPAMAASCRDNTTLDTGLRAVGGGALGAGLTPGSAGGVIGGAVIGGLIGNSGATIAKIVTLRRYGETEIGIAETETKITLTGTRTIGATTVDMRPKGAI